MKQLEFTPSQSSIAPNMIGRQEASQTARHADNAGHGAHAFREIIADVFEGRRHAASESDTERERSR